MNYKRVTIVVFAVIIGAYITLRIPTDFNVSYSAMEIRLSDTEYNVPLKVEFDGKIKKDFLLHKSYVGALSFDGNNILNNYDDVDEIILDLTEQDSILGSGIMISQYGTPITKTDWPWIGNVMFSEEMDRIVITIAEDGGWNVESGLIIAGPAVSRKQAESIFDTMIVN